MWQQTSTTNNTTSSGQYNVPTQTNFIAYYADKLDEWDDIFKENWSALWLHISAESKRFDQSVLRVRSRHGYQQMARLPCYRGTRTR